MSLPLRVGRVSVAVGSVVSGTLPVLLSVVTCGLAGC
jgi:hypothetical protein